MTHSENFVGACDAGEALGVINHSIWYEWEMHTLPVSIDMQVCSAGQM